MSDDLEKIAKFIGLATALLLLTAVAFNYGYFRSFGIVWITKLTIQDHFNTAVRYLLNFLFVQVLAAILCWIQRRSPPDLNSKIVRVTNFITTSVLTGAVITAASILKGELGVLLFALAFIFIWFGVYEYTVWHLELTPSLPAAALIQIAPVTIILVMFFGYIEGNSQQESSIKNLEIQLTESRILSNLNPLAMLSDGVLAEDRKCKCTIFVPHNQIKQMNLTIK